MAAVRYVRRPKETRLHGPRPAPGWGGFSPGSRAVADHSAIPPGTVSSAATAPPLMSHRSQREQPAMSTANESIRPSKSL